ncbi:hypothetical protein [Kitasatospora brasiliensis]|uniref:hypothetical protein n=1 Tax=Kitasatospora brasiliensis TaxID=3058040 RepID=UPI0029319922|nr:hypothetical protein [Kitasatospora sp. K002]
MATVLIIGFDPHTVPGMDGDAVRAVLDAELARFAEHGIDVATALVAPDDTAEPAVVAALSGREWDVVVIGGGIRKPEPALPFFELVVNHVRRHAPGAALAFNTGIADSLEAARRWL